MIDVNAFWARVRSGACTVDSLFFHNGQLITMLMYSILIKDFALMESLLSANADPNIKTPSHDAAIFIAVRTWGNHTDTFQKILSILSSSTSPSIGVLWDIRTVASMNAIHLATSMGMASACIYLEMAGVPTNACTSSGQTTSFYKYRMAVV